MANTQTTLSSQIFSSRDQIRNQIIEYARTYLELENVELVKGSFLSFIVETLSTLTSNLIFYESSTYKEFFLTKAQIPESVFNLSAFLGYNTVEASYATASVMLTIPLDFNNSPITINIPNGFQFFAKTIPFTTYYNTDITVTNNSQVSITVTEGNKIINLPYIIDTTSNNNFIFVLPVRQYETVSQQFQIDEDLQSFQFSYVDVPLDGKVSTMTVSVTDPDGIASTIYTEFNSLYLMASDDYGYVSRRTDFGRRIYFGNGLIGVQPTPGSTVNVSVQETLGISGNVIGGSIATGDNLYTLDGLINKNISYTVINPVSAIGGKDEESIEEIRKNSIDNLTSLHRLVSQNDYINADVVMPESPISSNSLPVLKRSDLRVNEIQLYTNLLFGSDPVVTNNLVPTRNAYNTYPAGTTYVPRMSTITVDDSTCYTLFDMRIDSIYNNIAYYTYIMSMISQTPTLVRSFALGSPYILTANNLIVSKTGSTATLELSYNTTEVDYDEAECTMQILSSGATYNMNNDSANKKFIYTFSDYMDIPAEEQTFYFTLINPSNQSIAIYSNVFTFRRSLDSFMLSNISSSDSTSVVVYDIPVILQSYYDSINQSTFEIQVLQSILTDMNFINYRMLTDFVNLKFGNTTGKSRAMLLNEVTKLPVIDISSLPLNPSLGDKYIVAECDSINEAHKNQIAQCVDATSVTWVYTMPVSNDIIYVTNKNKKYLYTGKDWFAPIYDIPLVISVEVFKDDTYSGSDIDLTNSIRSGLIEEFGSRFGLNCQIYRSEIIKYVQGLDGVSYCTLIEPKSDIFFNFLLEDLTQDELLKYGPEYIYFNTNSISIRIL
jgi:hypothetical protein